MAHCDEYIELLSAALDGALSPTEQARLGDHLAQCPDCKALFNDLNRIHQTLLELPPVEVPAGLTDRILEAVAKDNITALPKSKKAVLPWKRTLAAAAVFALILLGAGTLRGQLNATKSVVPESLMAEPQNNEVEEIDPRMSPRISKDVTNEEPQVPAQDYQGVSVPAAGQETDTADSVKVTPVVQPDVPPEEPAQDTAQGAAKQSPTSSSEIQTTGAQAPETAPLPEITTFSVNPTDAFTDAGEESYDPADSLLMVSMISQTPEANGALLPTPNPDPSGEETPEGTDSELPNPESTELLMDEPISLTVEEALERLTGFLQHENLPLGVYELPGGAQVTPMLEYLGLSPNEAYHEFAFSNMMVDDPETGLAHTSVINLYAVPLDGGDILIQHTDDPEGLNIYLEATGH